MLSHANDIIIDISVGSTGHGKYVVDGLNATNKWYLSMLMTTVQLHNATKNNSQMVIHTSTENTYISLAKEFQNHLSSTSHAHGL